MLKKCLFTVATAGCLFAIQTGVSASTLENETLGIRMEIDDQDQLEIYTRDLINYDEADISVSELRYQEEVLAYIFTMSDEADAAGGYNESIESMVENGWQLCGDKVQENGLTYYFFSTEPVGDEKTDGLIQSICDSFDQIEYSTPVAHKIESVDFKAITLDGKEVGKEIFEDKDVTMINIWATTCNPCLNEFPEMVKWEAELPDNAQILYLDYEAAGIDKLDKSMMDVIIRKTGLDPDRVMQCERGFSNAIDRLVTVTPTTIFVDSNGNIVGDIIQGARVEAYKEAIAELLESK